MAIVEPTSGAARLAVYAQRLWRVRVAPSTVQRLLRRHGLGTRLGHAPAVATCAMGTPSTSRPPNDLPGRFRIGKFKVARILPVLSHTAVAAILRQVMVRLFRRAGWTVQRVLTNLTDGGGEFKGSFDELCAVLGIRHTRIKPRHAWTTAFSQRRGGKEARPMTTRGFGVSEVVGHRCAGVVDHDLDNCSRSRCLG